MNSKSHNLIFPLAGFGNRFKKVGYKQTKPLIHAGKKTIIEWAVNSIYIDITVNLIFVVRRDQCIRYGIDSFLKQVFPECNVIIIDRQTNGSLETVLLALKESNLSGHLHIHTSDIALPNQVDIRNIFENNRVDAFTYTFKANNPSYSYCKFSKSNTDYIECMREKEVISQIANVGIYSFRDPNDFIESAEEIIGSEIKQKSEYYISSVFNLMTKKNKKVKSIDIPEVHVIGTPSELDFFTRFIIPTMKPRKIGFVSDHSGYIFKDKIMKLFQDLDYLTVNYGCYSESSCDYSDYIPIATKGMNEFEVDLIIASCRSGQGINICANHQPNVISILPSNEEALIQARKHNCPNFITFSSEKWDPKDAIRAFENSFVKSHFEGGRHSTRIQKFIKEN